MALNQGAFFKFKTKGSEIKTKRVRKARKRLEKARKTPHNASLAKSARIKNKERQERDAKSKDQRKMARILENSRKVMTLEVGMRLGLS
jgi:hypothetical protein